MSNPQHEDILKELLCQFYDRQLINNVYRGHYAECMIRLALRESIYGPWQLSYDWSPWDLESEDGRVRIQVKQSAARQTWTDDSNFISSNKPVFGIEPKKGYYASDGTEWIELDCPRRMANIYIFAWHPESDPYIADHRRTEQWRFLVAPEPDLPPGQKTIGLNPLRKYATEVGYNQLAETIDHVVSSLSDFKRDSE